MEGNCWKPKGGVEVGESDMVRRRKLKAGEIGLVFATIIPRAGKLVWGVIPQDGANDEGRCIARPVAKTDEGGEKREDCIKGREG